MTPQLIVFFVLAALAVLGAVTLIAARHPIHSALALIVVMVALAGLYLLQGAEFVAAVQIIVYGGAIMVLFVFVIMLLNAGEEERTSLSRIARVAGIPLALALSGFLAAAVLRSSHAAAQAPVTAASTRGLSMLLFREFVFPFELTSFLILVAILGALVLAQREN
ncbi:MAG: NADH-quinone oxidoreductase subunit J [Acidobacteriia bacterium]|nr:NADH-quinone oxidoreductase subunit J [Terriglobia bacterium]